MIEVKPFRAVLYNSKKFKSFSNLVCPPYDIISKNEQGVYYSLSPYNIIRLILGKEYKGDTKSDNKYTRSAKYLKEWIDKEVLSRDSHESIYFHQQKYKINNKAYTRNGFIALLRLKEEAVHPHEHTHLKPKEDRMCLLKHVWANLSPIFILFPDSGKYISKIGKSVSLDKPILNVTDKYGVKNKLWRFRDEKMVVKVSSYMQNKDMFIADGHHRFEVACLFRDMLKNTLADFSQNAPYNYIMAYFTDMNSKDLTIMATHRLISDIGNLREDEIVEKLSKEFSVNKLRTKFELLRSLNRTRNIGGGFGMCFKNSYYFLHFKKPLDSDILSRLDVNIFNKYILNQTFKKTAEDKILSYSSDTNEAIDLAAKGKVKVAFLLNPTKISQLKEVVLRGKKMPPKSTYFYPKLLSGMLIHKFN